MQNVEGRTVPQEAVAGTRGPHIVCACVAYLFIWIVFSLDPTLFSFFFVLFWRYKAALLLFYNFDDAGAVID